MKSALTRNMAAAICSAGALVVAGLAASQVASNNQGVNALPKRGEQAQPIGTGIEALTTERVASGLTRPIFATHAPGDFEHLYIIEKQGRIRVLNIDTGVLQTIGDAFLNIDPIVTGGTTANSEQGLLGLAFHPDYQNNGLFYVCYTIAGNDTRIREYFVDLDTDPLHADTGTFTDIITIDQPQSNHNGGWLGFSPIDGYLYAAVGDGGSFCDQGTGHSAGGNAQDTTNNLLGKMLRLDIDTDDFPGDATKNYGIPADNPFVGTIGDDEIWAYGLRNPWRCSFDRQTGDLWMADVGQGSREEINRQLASSAGGEDYGWRRREGFLSSSSSGCSGGNINGATQPLSDYNYGGSPFKCAITGGYVYRGCAIPTLDGHYFFADYCSDQIWTGTAADIAANAEVDRTSELDPPSFSITSITSFGEDAFGEIYICDQDGGEVFKVVPVTPTVDCVATQDADAFNINVVLGTINQGDVDSIDSSDDDYLEVEGELNGQGTKYRTRTIVKLTSPFLSVEQLDVRIETGCNDDLTGLPFQKLFIWNWNAGGWRTLGTGLQPKEDTINLFENEPNPDRFIEDTTGEIRIRVFNVIAESKAPNGLQNRIDEVTVTLTP